MLNVAHKPSVSWRISCGFCYRHKFWYNLWTFVAVLFSFYLFLSHRYSCFFYLNRFGYLTFLLWWFIHIFSCFLDLLTCICIKRSMLTWSFKNEGDECLWSSVYRKTLSLFIKLLSLNHAAQLAIHQFHWREKVSRADLLRTISCRAAAVISQIQQKKPFGVRDTNEASATSSLVQFLWSGNFPGWSHQISELSGFLFYLECPWLRVPYGNGLIRLSEVIVVKKVSKEKKSWSVLYFKLIEDI